MTKPRRTVIFGLVDLGHGPVEITGTVEHLSTGEPVHDVARLPAGAITGSGVMTPESAAAFDAMIAAAGDKDTRRAFEQSRLSGLEVTLCQKMFDLPSPVYLWPATEPVAWIRLDGRRVATLEEAMA